MSEFGSYDKYQLQWLISHKYSLSDLIKAVSKFADEYKGENKNSLSFCDFFHLWEFEQEMSGDLYANYDTWLYCVNSADDDVPKSSYKGDYSPSCPWGAEGMNVHDFI